MSKRLFTLYELAIVIVVLAIIAAIVLPNVTGRTADAKVAALKQDLAHIEQALMQQEMEEPEAEVLKKVAADEISPTLKASVEKNLKDDASEMYRVDMNKLKPYLIKTKYGHLDDQEDEYFLSKKTGLVYYEKGIAPSKGQRVHFLGERPTVEKPSAVLPILNKTQKVYATPAAIYYLMENGDLYGEGYNFYGSLFTDKDIMTEKNANEGTLIYQKRRKIAENVRDVNLPPILSIKIENHSGFSAYITKDDVAHVVRYGPNFPESKRLVTMDIPNVDHIRDMLVFYKGNAGDSFGVINDYESHMKQKLVIDDYPVPATDAIGLSVLLDKNGQYFGLPAPQKSENIGKPVTLLRIMTGYGALFSMGDELYSPMSFSKEINGESVMDVDMAPKLEGTKYADKPLTASLTKSGKLYLGDLLVDTAVSKHHLWHEQSLLYLKQDKLMRYNAVTQSKTVLVDNVKSMTCNGSVKVFNRAFCGVLTKDNKLFIGMRDEVLEETKEVVGVNFRLGASGVSSFTMNETHEFGDVVFYKDVLGATHIVRDNNGIIEDRTVVSALGAIIDILPL